MPANTGSNLFAVAPVSPAPKVSSIQPDDLAGAFTPQFFQPSPEALQQRARSRGIAGIAGFLSMLAGDEQQGKFAAATIAGIREQEQKEQLLAMQAQIGQAKQADELRKEQRANRLALLGKLNLDPDNYKEGVDQAAFLRGAGEYLDTGDPKLLDQFQQPDATAAARNQAEARARATAQVGADPELRAAEREQDLRDSLAEFDQSMDPRNLSRSLDA